MEETKNLSYADEVALKRAKEMEQVKEVSQLADCNYELSKEDEEALKDSHLNDDSMLRELNDEIFNQN